MPEPFSLTLGFGPQEGWSQTGGPGAEMAQRDKGVAVTRRLRNAIKSLVGWEGGDTTLEAPTEKKRVSHCPQVHLG